MSSFGSSSRRDHLQLDSGSVIANSQLAETATYCWKHSGQLTDYSHLHGDASLRTANNNNNNNNNNNRMFGTHLKDASSRTSNQSSHPQDASDNTDKKQQASATHNEVLAKMSAALCEVLAKNSHHNADMYAETYPTMIHTAQHSYAG